MLIWSGSGVSGLSVQGARGVTSLLDVVVSSGDDRIDLWAPSTRCVALFRSCRFVLKVSSREVDSAQPCLPGRVRLSPGVAGESDLQQSRTGRQAHRAARQATPSPSASSRLAGQRDRRGGGAAGLAGVHAHVGERREPGKCGLPSRRRLG